MCPTTAVNAVPGVSVCLSVLELSKMVAKTNAKAVLYGTLALATGASCLRTSFSVSELSNIVAGEASLQEEYAAAQTARQAAVAADTNPSLLYPAHNLSVPIDHFHNDSLYEPHVSLKSLNPSMSAFQTANLGHHRRMTLSI